LFEFYRVTNLFAFNYQQNKFLEISTILILLKPLCVKGFKSFGTVVSVVLGFFFNETQS